jgi:LssY-like putative type I secretion system component LssY
LLLGLCFCSAAPAAANCEKIPAGKTFWVRLVDPVASYSSKPGTSVRAILIQSPECDFVPVFPAGLEVSGQVSSVRKVGMGFLHDSASLEIQFDRIVTANGSVLPIASQVVEIDNSREAVRNGVIRGIRATNTPQGRITSRLIHLPTFNPYSDMGLIVYRALTVLPEPEIYLPPGTDVRLRLNVPLYVGDQPELPRVSFQMDEYERGDVELILQHSSNRSTTRGGTDADIVNVLFVGSGEQIDEAFTAAGWLGADRYSKLTFVKQFAAFLTLSSYPTMPISRQLLNGQQQDLTWQKSFNAYGKREHLRLWSQSRMVQDQQAWLGTYTRETSAVLSLRYHKFIHHIDRNVDDGVNMLVRDLSLTGCVETVRQLRRPGMPEVVVNSTGDEMKTDGVLTVVHLKHCEQPSIQYERGKPLIAIHPRSRIARYFRSQILVYKSDVIRGNFVYSAFDLTRMSLRSFRHRHRSNDEDDDDLPMSPVSPDTLFPQIKPGEIPLAVSGDL